jgi:hypothetical protein
MGNNTWNNDIDPFPIARGAAFNTFSTAKDVSPLPLKYTYGNELKVGSIVELMAVGEYSTTGTPTMRLGFAYGITSAGGLLSTGVALAGSDLVATVSGAAAFGWKMHYLGLVTADGAAGTLYGHGTIELSSTLILASAKPIPVTAAARQSTIDTTVKKTWHVFAEFGTSAAGNQVIVDALSVTIRNQGKPAQ